MIVNVIWSVSMMIHVVEGHAVPVRRSADGTLLENAVFAWSRGIRVTGAVATIGAVAVGLVDVLASTVPVGC